VLFECRGRKLAAAVKKAKLRFTVENLFGDKAWGISKHLIKYLKNRASQSRPQPVPKVKIQDNFSIDSWDISLTDDNDASFRFISLESENTVSLWRYQNYLFENPDHTD